MEWKDGNAPTGAMRPPDLSAETENGTPIIPPGLESLYAACRKIYPEQVNPLQVTALVKYWSVF